PQAGSGLRGLLVLTVLRPFAASSDSPSSKLQPLPPAPAPLRLSWGLSSEEAVSILKLQAL
ncbi:hypothetical protein P7K49_039473, partial [Saguinus oedipus]